MRARFALVGMLAQILVLAACACGAATTNMPPPYYTVYADAVGAPLVRQLDILSMPLRENVRGNSTYINTRRYLLGPDNPNFLMTSDGSGLGENGKISVEALKLQAATSGNAAELARCRALARWLASPAGPSPRAQIRAKAEAAIARAAQLPHPRVFATLADFDALKDRAKSDALVRAGIARTILAADDWVGREASEFKLLGYQLLVVSRQTVARLVSEAFAYRMTGDKKYVEDVAKELQAVCSFPNWNPRHTIDTGEMALAVAVAYDWMFDALSPEDRETVAQALLRMGLDCEPPFAGWTRLQNNWVQVVSAGKTAAAIALADRAPRSCADHLAAIVECLPEAETVCAPDGVYPEGPGYWNYGTSFNVICIDMMRKAFDHDFNLSMVRGLQETGYYPALMTGPSGDWFNYSDSHGARGSSPAVWWFSRIGHLEAVTDAEVEAFRKICDGTTKELPRTLPFIIFWVGENRVKARGRLPNIWVGQGEMPIGVVSADRSNRIAPYLAIKGGSPSYNHGHADAGSFVLDIQGLRWAFDLGAENYREVEKAIGPSGLWSPEPDSKRWSVFRLGTQGHNTLMIGGKGQDPRGFATLEREVDAVGHVGDTIVADLSSVYPMAKKVVRRVSVDKSLGAHIVDTIEGAAPGTTVRWAMNTDATLAHMPERTVPTMKCTKNVSVIEVSESTARGAWSEGSAQPSNDWEQPNPGMRQLVYTATVPGSGNLTLTVAFKTVNAIAVPHDYLWKEKGK